MINNTQDLIKIVDEKLHTAPEEEKEKLLVLKNFFSNPTCFFDISSQVALNILGYLGLNETEQKNAYIKLIGPKAYQEKPKVRETLSRKM